MKLLLILTSLVFTFSFHQRLLFNKNINNKYPLSNQHFEQYLKRLNSKNITIQNDTFEDPKISPHILPQIIIIQNNDDDNEEEFNRFGKKHYNYDNKSNKNIKSKHFEIIKNSTLSFNDIGGYTEIKENLYQMVDLLKNNDKYKDYTVRTPKGLIFEGSPGTGKTLFAKAFASEANCNFIVASGSDFALKFIGEGEGMVKELFKLASENTPCIIFIDEIDAVGKKRSDDGQSASKEHDNTLNALLVELNGFKPSSGIFLIGATNRIDLLDPALTRPGRIDEIIHIPNPNHEARKSIIDIHIKGKPHDETIDREYLVDSTDGYSGAQIENLLNKAMLYAIKNNKNKFNKQDFEYVFDRTIVGWQPIDHDFNHDTIEKIAIHEIGHAISAFYSLYFNKIKKVSINLKSPKSPGYTLFEPSTSSIFNKEYIIESLVVTLSGRIAEQIVYGNSVSTGASDDFKNAIQSATKFVLDYGMSDLGVIPNNSEKYKTLLDDEIYNLIKQAENKSIHILNQHKHLLLHLSKILVYKRDIYHNELNDIIRNFYDEKKQNYFN
jgi:cell division protease FtsH